MSRSKSPNHSPRFREGSGQPEIRIKMRHQNPASFQAKMKSKDFYNYDSRPRFEFNSNPKISTEDFCNKLSSHKRLLIRNEPEYPQGRNMWESFFLKTSPSGFLEKHERHRTPSPHRLDENSNSLRTIRPMEERSPSTPRFSKGKRILKNPNRESDSYLLTPEKYVGKDNGQNEGKGKKTFPWELVRRYRENLEAQHLGKKFVDLSNNMSQLEVANLLKTKNCSLGMSACLTVQKVNNIGSVYSQEISGPSLKENLISRTHDYEGAGVKKQRSKSFVNLNELITSQPIMEADANFQKKKVILKKKMPDTVYRNMHKSTMKYLC